MKSLFSDHYMIRYKLNQKQNKNQPQRLVSNEETANLITKRHSNQNCVYQRRRWFATNGLRAVHKARYQHTTRPVPKRLPVDFYSKP